MKSNLSGSHLELLLTIARESIEREVARQAPDEIDLARLPAELSEHRACFVTLLSQGKLRGCIGSVEDDRALALEVADHARAAGFRDPRFSPLGHDELRDLAVEISILSPREPLAARSREDLLGQLRPGVDGLIVEEGRARGVFLPSVWKQLPTPEAFVRQLMHKAGLPKDHWSDELEFSRFTTRTVSSTRPPEGER